MHALVNSDHNTRRRENIMRNPKVVASDKIKVNGVRVHVSTVHIAQFGYYETCVFWPGQETQWEHYSSPTLAAIGHAGWVGKVKERAMLASA
ncbi:hypothetical protein SEA_REINDEER_154 [Mycobacterium phage Reindeer]|uniref:Uncharacterized protein n=1 Tax=Mycobacterium phage Reindeer TaxID=2762283 RepID=A0A7G8LI73_9CAUD|nr:hypothetical protein J4U05_gp098 [Mycobacterium phage Reindeer]QNJ56945.1 hypothetical protein SEA_REINDEER_154 [Mycobacterium phage Reindeer]